MGGGYSPNIGKTQHSDHGAHSTDTMQALTVMPNANQSKVKCQGCIHYNCKFAKQKIQCTLFKKTLLLLQSQWRCIGAGIQYALFGRGVPLKVSPALDHPLSLQACSRIVHNHTALHCLEEATIMFCYSSALLLQQLWYLSGSSKCNNRIAWRRK